MSGPGFDRADLQGNIVRGYGRNRTRHLVIEVGDRVAARRWLATAASGGSEDVPAITTEEHWGKEKPPLNVNVGITFRGLQALGVPNRSLTSFPTEFTEGMESRAAKLGDVGESAPENWDAPFQDMSRVHIIISLRADEVEPLDQGQAMIAEGGKGRAFVLLGICDGANFDGANVHFGYRDNISQPRFKGIHDPDRFPDMQPQMPLGTILLGFPTAYEGIRWKLPRPDPLGMLGSFNAFRVLEQDVAGFEAFLDSSAEAVLADPRADQVLSPDYQKVWKTNMSPHEAMREVIAAKMLGRWRNGTPLELSPDNPNPDPKVSLTEFDYHDDGRCPFGSHTRRCNPRGGPIVQRIANNTRRLVRRGMPYGPAYDPKKPDDRKRGLLGNFLCANLGAQFEAVMCDWLNLGLEDPHITGTNDPLLGANDPLISYFDIDLEDGEYIRLRGLPRFVKTRGGAYTFLPSLPALRWLATIKG